MKINQSKAKEQNNAIANTIGAKHTNNTKASKQLRAQNPILQNAATSHAQPSEQGSTAQLTIYNMGDDEKLASKDGPNISKHIKQEYIELPIPQMEDIGMELRIAENPVTILMHGSTLQEMGAIKFANKLIQKGFMRGEETKEIVLITCSAAPILVIDGQNLANHLHSKIYAAKGKVVVGNNGIPSVTVSKKGEDPVTTKDDIFSLIAAKMPQEATNWVEYVPHPPALLRQISRDIDSNLQKLLDLDVKLKRLDARKNVFNDTGQLENEIINHGLFTKSLEKMKPFSDDTMEYANELRRDVDEINRHTMFIEKTIEKYETLYRDKTGRSIFMDSLMDGVSVEDAGSGWGDTDLTLD